MSRNASNYWFECVLPRTLAITGSFCLADSAIEVSASKSVCRIRQTLSKHSGPCFPLPEETLALRRLVSPERDPGVGMGELVVKCALRRTLAFSFRHCNLCCKSSHLPSVRYSNFVIEPLCNDFKLQILFCLKAL